MTTIHVFDPAMCCSTGICGPSVDEQLVRFAADLDWLKSHGVQVERFNLSQQPAAFAADVEVRDALQAKGEAALPLIKVNADVQSMGMYPSRGQLAKWAGVAYVAAPTKSLRSLSVVTASDCCPPSGDGTSSCC